MKKISLTTHQRNEAVDITPLISSYLKDIQAKSGALTVFSPHTTAGITINENADPDVRSDMIRFLSELVPHQHNFAHAEGNSDSHIKGTLCGFSTTLIIEDGSPQLGTWQSVYFMEFDGPRQRQVWLKFIPA